MHALKSYRPNDPTRPTVCLVHGVNSSSGGFVHMIPRLEEAGYGVVVFDYRFNRSLEESCRMFARDWAAFRRSGESRPWALVTHSMGALLARDYVEGPSYQGDVSTLVMIAPVNQGSHLAKTQTLLQLLNGAQAVNGRKTSDALAHLGDGLGEAADDMTPGERVPQGVERPAETRGALVSHPRGRRRRLARAGEEADRGAGRGGEKASGAFRRSGPVGGRNDLSDRLDELTDGRGDGCVSVADDPSSTGKRPLTGQRVSNHHRVSSPVERRTPQESWPRQGEKATMGIPTLQQIKSAKDVLRRSGKGFEAEWMHAAWQMAAAENRMGAVATSPTRSARVVPIRKRVEAPPVEPGSDGPSMVRAEWPDGQRIDGLLVEAAYGKDHDGYLVEVAGVRLTIVLAHP